MSEKCTRAQSLYQLIQERAGTHVINPEVAASRRQQAAQNVLANPNISQEIKADYGQKLEDIFNNQKYTAPGQRRMQDIYNVGLVNPTKEEGPLKQQIVEAYDSFIAPKITSRCRVSVMLGTLMEYKGADGDAPTTNTKYYKPDFNSAPFKPVAMDGVNDHDVLAHALENSVAEELTMGKPDSKFKLALFTNISFRVFHAPTEPIIGGVKGKLPKVPAHLSKKRLYTPPKRTDQLCIFDCIRTHLKTKSPTANLASKYALMPETPTFKELCLFGINGTKRANWKDFQNSLAYHGPLLEKCFDIKLFVFAHDEEADTERGHRRSRLSVVPLYLPQTRHKGKKAAHILLTAEGETDYNRYTHAHLVKDPKVTLCDFTCSVCSKIFTHRARRTFHQCRTEPLLHYPGGPHKRQFSVWEAVEELNIDFEVPRAKHFVFWRADVDEDGVFRGITAKTNLNGRGSNLQRYKTFESFYKWTIELQRLQVQFWEDKTSSLVTTLQQVEPTLIKKVLDYGKYVPCISLPWDLRTTNRWWGSGTLTLWTRTWNYSHIARYMGYKSAEKKHGAIFYVPKGAEEGKNIEQMIHDNLAGGPSVVYSRVVDDEKVLTFDANSLYAWAMSQDMPVGRRLFEFTEHTFKAFGDRQTSIGEIAWINELRRQGHTISTPEDSPSTRVRVTGRSGKRYQPDGINLKTKTVYEYLGNYWHAGDGEKLKATEKKLQDMRDSGWKVIYIWESDFLAEYPHLTQQVADEFYPHHARAYYKGNMQQRKRIRKELMDPHQMAQKVRDGVVFGFAEVDLEKAADEEFHGLFYRRNNRLVNSKEGTKVLLHTPYLATLLKYGYQITRVYTYWEFPRGKPFQSFVDRAMVERKKNSPSAGTWKLLINSFYGGTIMDKRNYNKTCSTSSDTKRGAMVMSPTFRDLIPLGAKSQAHIISSSAFVHLNVPTHLGKTILDLAKLHMVEFYYEVVKKLNGRLISFDTDAFTFALDPSTTILGTMDSATVHKWFDDTENPERLGTKKKWTPGLFHLESKGTCARAVGPKMVCVSNKDGGTAAKVSCKGIKRSALPDDPINLFDRLLQEYTAQKMVAKAPIMRKTRQAGWGNKVVRRKHQEGWGKKKRLRSRRHRQRGRGAKWNKVKSFARRAWKKISPTVTAAGRRAIPSIAKAVITGSVGNPSVLKNVASNFGKNVLRGLIKRTMSDFWNAQKAIVAEMRMKEAAAAKKTSATAPKKKPKVVVEEEEVEPFVEEEEEEEEEEEVVVPKSLKRKKAFAPPPKNKIRRVTKKRVADTSSESEEDGVHEHELVTMGQDLAGLDNLDRVYPLLAKRRKSSLRKGVESMVCGGLHSHLTKDEKKKIAAEKKYYEKVVKDKKFRKNPFAGKRKNVGNTFVNFVKDIKKYIIERVVPTKRKRAGHNKKTLLTTLPPQVGRGDDNDETLETAYPEIHKMNPGRLHEPTSGNFMTVDSTTPSQNDLQSIIEYVQKRFKGMSPEEATQKAKQQTGSGVAIPKNEMIKIPQGDRFKIFNQPSQIVIAGPTKSGKTSLLIKVLENADTMFQPPPQEIYWFYSMPASVAPVKATLPEVQLVHGIPNPDLIEKIADGSPKIMVMDDMQNILNDKTQREMVMDVLTKVSHHGNLTVIFIVQDLYRENMKRVRNQCENIIVMSNGSSANTAVGHLGSSIFSKEGSPFLKWVLQKTRELSSHGYFLVSTGANVGIDQVRTNILPGDKNIIFVQKNTVTTPAYAELKDHAAETQEATAAPQEEEEARYSQEEFPHHGYKPYFHQEIGE
ncbi:hypothetical protein CAPTEDRAFT_214459 [Capitella teleta]|uniref:DNA-directed DNA polymerase n=1 Tax=Capitella teleta TaxID=283909 RepID=R7US93_CAPTE|nr:hypothetical protein CAPTEDRAFT_214459 [Capitella teleta]|eukprot:ELU09008.1 hypothetical protein CAPTEDRAFT_214459 [Capitella teleta]